MDEQKKDESQNRDTTPAWYRENIPEEPATPAEPPVMNRAERRREEKETHGWNQDDWGPMNRTFDKCPTCGCPSRFSVEAMRPDMGAEQLNKRPPALGAFTFNYEGMLFNTRIDVVLDSCCKCGTIYTIARSKMKVPRKPDISPHSIRPPFGRG